MTKKIIFASAVLALLSTAAFGADLAPKPVAAPEMAPTYDTGPVGNPGWYGLAGLGFDFGSAKLGGKSISDDSVTPRVGFGYEFQQGWQIEFTGGLKLPMDGSKRYISDTGIVQSCGDCNGGGGTPMGTTTTWRHSKLGTGYDVGLMGWSPQFLRGYLLDGSGFRVGAGLGYQEQGVKWNDVETVALNGATPFTVDQGHGKLNLGGLYGQVGARWDTGWNGLSLDAGYRFSDASDKKVSGGEVVKANLNSTFTVGATFRFGMGENGGVAFH